MASRTSHPQPQQPQGEALDRPPSRQKGGRPRFALRIERHACQLLDPDNFAGGCKALIDVIRGAGLIPDDDLQSCTITFEQIKVTRRADQGTRLIVTEHPA